MPILYWDKVHETGNLSYLLISDTIHIEKKQPSLLRKYALRILWRELLEQYVQRFGFSESFLEAFRKEKEIVSMGFQRMASNDRSLNAFIKIAEQELAEIKNQGKRGTFDQTLASVEKFMGYSIDPARCSVSKFYSYIALMDRQAKLAKQQ